jgi:hypothetical protein
VSASHPSFVQAFPSSQDVGPPGVHVVFTHASPVVQASPSSHGPDLAECVQPFFELHVSSVQTLPSSQFGAGPPLQEPLPHTSFVVHASPSVQGREFAMLVHPCPEMHFSSVQTLSSLGHVTSPDPTHWPLAHMSVWVHGSPSLHGTVFGV